MSPSTKTTTSPTTDSHSRGCRAWSSSRTLARHVFAEQPPKFVTSLWSLTSTMARPPWSTHCCVPPAPSLPTRPSSTESWTPTTRSASAASPFSPRPLPSPGRAPRSTWSTRPATPTSVARSSARSRWSTVCCCWSMLPRARCRRPATCCRRRLRRNLPAIVIINKVDRQDARAEEVLDEVYQLFIDLDAGDEHIDFEIISAIARDGKAMRGIGYPDDDADLWPAARHHPRGHPGAGRRYRCTAAGHGHPARRQRVPRPSGHRSRRQRRHEARRDRCAAGGRVRRGPAAAQASPLRS